MTEKSAYNSGYKDGWYTFIYSNRRITSPDLETLGDMVKAMPYSPAHKNQPGYWDGWHAGHAAAIDCWNELGQR